MVIKSTSYPRIFNHIAVGVSDLDRAIKFYTEIFGFVLLRGPFEVLAHEGHPGEMASDVLGPTFGQMRQAHLGTANGVGFELFQLVSPSHQRREPSLEYWKNGFFHICVTDPNVEELVQRMSESGGKQLSKVWSMSPDSPETRMCFCEDPFGNVIEIYSHSYEQLYGGKLLT